MVMVRSLASVIEGTIIAVSGLFLIYQAGKKYITGETSSYLDMSILVMIVSFIVTFALVRYLNHVADKTDNMVIKADALHYKTDLYSNGAVLVSLGLVYFTKIELVDIVVGLGIAIYIIYSAYELIKDGVLVLLDRAIDKEITTEIKKIIEENEFVKDYHFFKTREAGHQYFVDVHLVFTKAILLIDAHQASDNIEYEIQKLDDKKEWIFSIHLDPYDDSIEPNNIAS
jgi:cation diffusion facilitator family transporter